MDKTDGGPAFPSHGNMGEVTHEGMTLRDYFAAKALGGMVANPGQFKLDGLILDCTGRFAEAAYSLADAMLAERDK